MSLKALLLVGLAFQLLIGVAVLLLLAPSFEKREVRDVQLEEEAEEIDCPQNPSNPCPPQAREQKPFKTKLFTDMLVVVFSRPDAFAIRQACRETWMSELQDHSRAVYKFVTGTGNLSAETKAALREEAALHKDVVLLEGHTESFGLACTAKLLLTMQWASDNVDCRYFMKVDDDCYIRVAAILDTINTNAIRHPILHAHIRFNALPIRDGKYADTAWNYGEVYPPFPYGSGYTITFSVIKAIVRSNGVIPLRHFPNEDVTIGLWLTPYQIRYMDVKRFYYRILTEEEQEKLKDLGDVPIWPSDWQRIFVFHYDQSPELMRNAHRHYQEAARKIQSLSTSRT